MKIRMRAAASVAVVALASACTTAVAGSASPVPGQAPVQRAGDPCALLTPEQAASVGAAAKGQFDKGNRDNQVPPNCAWKPAGGGSTVDLVKVSLSQDMSLDEYTNGAREVERFDLGGFTWIRYASMFGKGFCSLDLSLSAKSFVSVFSTSDQDDSKACDVAKAVAPLVASHLPGGAPATSLPPPSTSASPSSGPLDSVQPCVLLKPEQATQLSLDPNTEPESTSSDKPSVPGCQWHDTDGARGQKALDVWVAPRKAATAWAFLEKGGDPVDANGKTWKLFSNPYNDGVNCSATLSVTPASSVMITSGYLDDPAKICDLVKTVIPLVAGNLPPF